MTIVTAPVYGLMAQAQRAAITVRVMRIVQRGLNLGAVRALDPDTRFFEDLSADSLDMVSLAMAAEEEFGIAVSDDAAAAIITVGDMVTLVAGLMAAPAVDVDAEEAVYAD